MTTTTTSTDTCSTYCSRDTHWFSTTGFSVIALIAFMKHIDGDIKDQEDYGKWTFSALIITLVFSSLSVLATLFIRKMFTDTLIEGGMVRFFFCFSNLICVSFRSLIFYLFRIVPLLHL